VSTIRAPIGLPAFPNVVGLGTAVPVVHVGTEPSVAIQMVTAFAGLMLLNVAVEIVGVSAP
jgi:hypothetical protein